MRTWRDARGWTLIEMTIVISLITILSTIALVGYRSAIVRSREAVLKEDLFRMRDAIDQHYADRGEYPADLEVLVTSGYLRSVPEDPFTNSASTWQAELAEMDPANPLSQGIFDIRSGSDQLALDGSQYSEW